MVKIIILLIIAGIVYFFYKSNNKENNDKISIKEDKKAIYYIHIIAGCIIALLFTIHGISKFEIASVETKITGLITLGLLYLEIILGIIMTKKESKSLKMLHKIIPVVILITLALHLVL